MRQLTPSDGSAQSKEGDLREVRIEADGTAWTIRVLGRSGGGSGRSAPLLLLGFWRAEAADGSPALEATVVSRTFAELSAASLETALSSASAPPAPSRKRSFFEEASRGRRR